jgi:hypothetical protein
MKWKILSLRLSESEVEKLDYLLVKLWTRREIDTFSRTAVIRYLIRSWWKVREILEEMVKTRKSKNEKE